MAKPINQGPGQGAYEDCVIQKGGGVNSTPLGNAVARNVGPGGPGKSYVVRDTGQQAQHGASNPGASRPRRNGDY